MVSVHDGKLRGHERDMPRGTGVTEIVRFFSKCHLATAFLASERQITSWQCLHEGLAGRTLKGSPKFLRQCCWNSGLDTRGP
jgi:hypothetical protein